MRIQRKPLQKLSIVVASRGRTQSRDPCLAASDACTRCLAALGIMIPTSWDNCGEKVREVLSSA